MTKRFARRLLGATSGATLIEFAIVTPVMLSLIMGMGELAYQGYVQSVLTGSVQKAGRDSTIQGNGSQTTQIDAVVMQAVWTVAKNATYTSTRKSYSTFSQAAQVTPEPFTDGNHNGQYDAATECFTDTNGNNTWDADPGLNGQGGASDVTIYSINISYRRLFPVFGLVGMSPVAALNATTTLKNQPWATQSVYTPKQVCPP